MLLLAGAALVGLVVASSVRLPLGAFARLGLGLALGQLLLLWLPFGLARAFDLNAAAAALVASFILVLGCGGVLARGWRDARRVLGSWATALQGGLGSRAHRSTVWTCGALLALFAWLLHTHYLSPGVNGLHSAGVTWGDLPIHFGLASRFLYADGLPALEHPLYLGGRLNYPFLPDYAAALLAAQGLSLRYAFIVGGLIPIAALCLLLHGLTRLWLGPDAPPRASTLTLGLFFLAGGLGFALFIARLFDGDASPLALLATTNATYLDPHVLKSGHIGNLFIAARTASFGMTLGAAALLVLGHLVQAEGTPPPRHAFALAGVLVGALPLVHGHSFVVLVGVVACYALLARRHGAAWLTCVVPLALFALPQLKWLADSGAPGNLRLVSGFLRPAPNAAEWLLDVLLGVGLPLVLVPLGWLATPRASRMLTAPLLLLLPLANLLTFTPSFYDNVKLLAWFDVAGSVLCAGLLASWLRPAAIFAFAACTASGWLAVGHELVNDAWVMSDADVHLAELVTTHTPPDAVIATAASYHDPVALLSGRRVVLATPRMLISHGLDPHSRVLDLVNLYAGGPPAVEVITRLGVDAVVVGPRERAAFPRLDEVFLTAYARDAFEQDGQRLYLLKPAR